MTVRSYLWDRWIMILEPTEEPIAVFVVTGPSPRMRFKRIQCPMVTLTARGVRSHCREQVMVFFKDIAICPVHGVVRTQEPWVEESGGQT